MARVTVWSGVVLLALLAAGMTEATVAYGPHGRLANDAALRPATPSATPTPTPVPTTSPVATPAVSAAPTPVPVQAAPTATTNGFVHLRASNSTSSAILIDLDAGTVVALLPYSDSLWQQVKYNGMTGYLWKAYLAY